jgi:hypothetical protein
MIKLKVLDLRYFVFVDYFEIKFKKKKTNTTANVRDLP